MTAHAQRLVAALLAALLAIPAQAGAPDYDTFCDRDGRITTREHGLGLIKLVSNAVELEAVFDESCSRGDQPGWHPMASDQPVDGRVTMPRFTWGDSVQVKVGAAPVMRPGALAEVVGVREVENEAQVRQFEAAIGSKLYLIEFGDGTSIEIPEEWLEMAKT